MSAERKEHNVTGLTEHELFARNATRNALVGFAAASIVGAKTPEKAAEYVANMLIVHKPRLLAALAVAWAGEDVRRLLAEEDGRNSPTVDAAQIDGSVAS